jgi:RHH-type proline utilization regulon transcriptional repressor/proline dehydrogenase/delta 1-pyrroline-5-carboxylate dehydrogenase
LQVLRHWALVQGLGAVVQACEDAVAQSPTSDRRELRGPTGEANLYAVRPRAAVLCLAPESSAGDTARLQQLAAVLAVGSHAVWPSSAQLLWARLPPGLRGHVTLAHDWQQPTVHFDAVLHTGTETDRQLVLAKVAQRSGAIVSVTAFDAAVDGSTVALPLARLVIEKSLSINTAAAGGNASLMTIG